MTFTTAAASEMRDRIGKVVGKAVAKEIVISTFHSFCLQLCRTHAEKYAFSCCNLLYSTTVFCTLLLNQQNCVILLMKSLKLALSKYENYQMEWSFHKKKTVNNVNYCYQDYLDWFSIVMISNQKFNTQRWSWLVLRFIKLLIIFDCTPMSQYITQSNVMILFLLYALFLIPCSSLQFFKLIHFADTFFFGKPLCRYLNTWIMYTFFKYFFLYDHLKARPHVWIHNIWTWTTTKSCYWSGTFIGKWQKIWCWRIN